MKKIGHFLFAFVPIILAIAVQYLAVFFGMGISALVEGTWYTCSGTADFYAVFDDLGYLWMTSRFNTYIMIIYAAMTIVIFGLWYYMRYEGNYLPNLRRTFHPFTILGVVLLTPGMQYLSTYIISFTASLFPKWLEQYMDLMENAGLDDSLTLGMFLYSVVFAPLSEELIFRGVTLRQCKKAVPFWVANLTQAALFGVFHMNMIQGIYAFFLGLILGYICERGGSIYHSILLHMLFNFWAAAISQFITMGDSAFAFLFWLFFAVAVTVCGIFVFMLGVKKCSLIPASGNSPDSSDNDCTSNTTNASDILPKM